MRICLLTDQDLDGHIDEDDWPCDPRPYIPEATWELAVLEKDAVVSQIIEMSQKGFDVFFNLCDGAWDEGRPGLDVVDALEKLDQAFTGANSLFFEPSREVMKRVCRAWGIGTPDYVIAKNKQDVERAAEMLRYPMIVKHPSSYASAGLTKKSRVETADELLAQSEIMMTTYAGALIEEFIEGLECTVLVADNPDDWGSPTTYQPIQYRFPEGETFKHYGMKWEDYAGLEESPVTDVELDARLRQVSADFFRGINGVGYGRCDLRVDHEGQPFMLEINPNCGMYYPATDPGSADLCLMNDPAGLEGFTRQIVKAAIGRHRDRRTGWYVRTKDSENYGLFVSRAFKAGERVVTFEGQPHELVTRRYVDSVWREPHLSWFGQRAWPLTEEVWAIWSRDPEHWKPIDHSCDPSCWLTGLDLVARRDLEPGDEVTLEYATLHNEAMPDFHCSCGAEDCRGTVRGTDHLADFVDRYGDHISDYVRTQRMSRRR
ncbi:MAG: hypothetical protein HKN37_10550 [Rhodothermales bacterium]|nr:hypothetical protein [Rhodothermales bacterium]